MEALKKSVNEHVQNTFHSLMNKYVNKMASEIAELAAKGQVKDSDVVKVMNSVLSSFSVEVNKPGGKSHESVKCKECDNNVGRKKEMKEAGLCSKCHKKSTREAPKNKDENGEILKCIHEKKATKTNAGGECGKNCCVKSDKYCAAHLKAHEKNDKKGDKKGVKEKSKKSDKGTKKSDKGTKKSDKKVKSKKSDKGKGKEEEDEEEDEAEEEEDEASDSEDEE